jgi:hypothetical protein
MERQRWEGEHYEGELGGRLLWLLVELVVFLESNSVEVLSRSEIRVDRKRCVTICCSKIAIELFSTWEFVAWIQFEGKWNRPIS